MQKRVRVIISGFVQGVGYRSFAKRIAQKHQLPGYVRNLYDGDVEVVIEGEEDTLVRMIEDLNKGPTYGRVQNTKVEWYDYKGEFNEFFLKF